MIKTAIIIPARMTATRLPGKPLADIAGKPMIIHVLERAIAAGIGPVYVACAEEEVANIVKNFGGNAVMTDPDHPSGSDRIAEALRKVDINNEFGAIVNLQGDLPLIDPNILKLSSSLLANPQTDIGTFAALIKSKEELDNPNVVKAVVCLEQEERQGKALYFSRSAVPYNADKNFHHIGIYVYRRQALEKFISLPPSYLERQEKLEQLRALENNMRIDVVIVDTVPIGVDTEQDLYFVRSKFKDN
jgi:3-deoxy-manno-octulosonate cytidylyltransferase (CMP-KDO synthetase)